MTDIPIYKEKENLVFQKGILPEGAYGEALKSFVVVCADTLLVNKSRRSIYLAKRKVKPLTDFWMIGGRVFAGESEQDAMVRLFKRETSLEISKDRFEFVRMHRLWFKDREQKPQETACDSLCYVFVLSVEDDAMVHSISSHLDPEEYDVDLGLVEFDEEKLKTSALHPAVIDVYESVFAHQT